MSLAGSSGGSLAPLLLVPAGRFSSHCGIGPAGLEVAHFLTGCFYLASLYSWICPCTPTFGSTYSLFSGHSP